MEKREIRIQMIPLNKLIDTLVDLYNKGLDYIDISGVPGEEYDKMSIGFTQDHMTEQGRKNFEQEDFEEELEIKSTDLTDDDLNQLI